MRLKKGRRSAAPQSLQMSGCRVVSQFGSLLVPICRTRGIAGDPSRTQAAQVSRIKGPARQQGAPRAAAGGGRLVEQAGGGDIAKGEQAISSLQQDRLRD
jgi:hypothetical protein